MSDSSSSPSGGLLITLKRSPIGTPYRHRLVLRGLGLRKMHDAVTRPNTPQVHGMIAKISYLLDVRSL
jgi:large subunit ribosomal protein L30